MIKVLPCPICFGTIKTTLHVGVLSAERMGVRCIECKLQIDSELPSKWPKNKPKNLKGIEADEWLRNYCLNQAVEKWNKFPRV